MNTQKCIVHDWKIWPESNGEVQRCMKCGAYRATPEADKFWLPAPLPR